MQPSWLQQVKAKRPWLAVVAGLCLALAFPRWHMTGLAWLAPALIVAAVRGLSRRTVFITGWLAGFIWSMVALYWLNYMPVPWLPILAVTALSAYLGVSMGLWAMFVARLWPHERAGEWGQRFRWALLGAVAWVAMEMIVGRFLSGFPWLFLGVTQYRMLPLIQIASVTGVYGVSFLIVWFSLSLFCAVERLIKEPTKQRACFAELVAPGLIIALVLAFGLHRLFSPAPATREVKLALIQPSIPQKVKWDAEANLKAFADVLRLSDLAAREQPDIVVWPEAAVPGLLRYDKELNQQITGFARSHHVWMVIGADDAEPKEGATDPNAADYYNSSFLIDPQGKIVETYRKQQLVIFGEYVPLADWLPFLKKLTPIEGGFTPGKAIAPFSVQDPDVTLSVLVCFEDVFPHVARRHVQPGIDFLVNLTNDGWFGESAEQWQHAANAIFRAVENGVPLVRCTNNGLTCWADAYGRLQGVVGRDDVSIYGPGFQSVRLPVLANSSVRQPTFYNQHGDVFGWCCVVVTVWALVRMLRRKKAGQ